MTNPDLEVTTVVLTQHTDIAERLASVSSTMGAERGAEFASLTSLLSAHEAAEESVIYPALRAFGDLGARIADERTAEEAAAEKALTTLKGLDVDSAEFETLFQEFSGKVHDHAASEAAHVLPLLANSLSPDERNAMGSAFLLAQQPTPHAG